MAPSALGPLNRDAQQPFCYASSGGRHADGSRPVQPPYPQGSGTRLLRYATGRAGLRPTVTICRHLSTTCRHCLAVRALLPPPSQPIACRAVREAVPHGGRATGGAQAWHSTCGSILDSRWLGGSQSWENTEPCEGRAAGAHRPNNAVPTRMPVLHAAAESHALV